MAKRDGKNGPDGTDERRPSDDALVIERLRRHLEFLGLNRTSPSLTSDSPGRRTSALAPLRCSSTFSVSRPRTSSKNASRAAST